MRALTTKEYLSQYYILDKRIKDKKDEMEKLKLVVNSVGSFAITEKVQSSGNLHKMSDTIAIIVDLLDEIMEQTTKLLKLKYEIMMCIEKTEKQEYKRLLELRYIKCMKWEEIAVDMGYSYNHIHRIHSRALLTIKKGKS